MLKPIGDLCQSGTSGAWLGLDGGLAYTVFVVDARATLAIGKAAIEGLVVVDNVAHMLADRVLTLQPKAALVLFRRQAPDQLDELRQDLDIFVHEIIGSR